MTTVISNQETLVNGYASPMSRELAIAAIEQYGDWDTFLETHADVCEHGMQAGFSGWTYTHDVVTFVENNKETIFNYAKKLAEEFGCDGMYSLIKGFNCLRGQFNADEIAEALHDSESEYYSTVTEALGWLIAEEVARACERMLEDAEQQD